MGSVCIIKKYICPLMGCTRKKNPGCFIFREIMKSMKEIKKESIICIRKLRNALRRMWKKCVIGWNMKVEFFMMNIRIN